MHWVGVCRFSPQFAGLAVLASWRLEADVRTLSVLKPASTTHLQRPTLAAIGGSFADPRTPVSGRGCTEVTISTTILH